MYYEYRDSKMTKKQYMLQRADEEFHSVMPKRQDLLREYVDWWSLRRKVSVSHLKNPTAAERKAIEAFNTARKALLKVAKVRDERIKKLEKQRDANFAKNMKRWEAEKQSVMDAIYVGNDKDALKLISGLPARLASLKNSFK